VQSTVLDSVNKTTLKKGRIFAPHSINQMNQPCKLGVAIFRISYAIFPELLLKILRKKPYFPYCDYFFSPKESKL
jgi:hypothetical protein